MHVGQSTGRRELLRSFAASGAGLLAAPFLAPLTALAADPKSKKLNTNEFMEAVMAEFCKHPDFKNTIGPIKFHCHITNNVERLQKELSDFVGAKLKPEEQQDLERMQKKLTEEGPQILVFTSSSDAGNITDLEYFLKPDDHDARKFIDQMMYVALYQHEYKLAVEKARQLAQVRGVDFTEADAEQAKRSIFQIQVILKQRAYVNQLIKQMEKSPSANRYILYYLQTSLKPDLDEQLQGMTVPAPPPSRPAEPPQENGPPPPPLPMPKADEQSSMRFDSKAVSLYTVT